MDNSHLKPYQFKPGQSGNPSGRPKGGLKDFDRKRFIAMNDEEKEKFLKTIPAEMRYKMAEGNPHQTQDTKHEGELILQVPKEVAESFNLDAHIDEETSGGNKEQE